MFKCHARTQEYGMKTIGKQKEVREKVGDQGKKETQSISLMILSSIS